LARSGSRQILHAAAIPTAQAIIALILQREAIHEGIGVKRFIIWMREP